MISKPSLGSLGLISGDDALHLQLVLALEKSKFFEESGDHTDEMETSLIIYLNPELVLPQEEAGDGNKKKSIIQGLQEKWARPAHKWSQVTEDTGIGNPNKASLRKEGFILMLLPTRLRS